MSNKRNIMFTYSFEKLEVWKESVELVKIIYKLTNKFPVDEKFGLTSQMKRAAISVASNISEGTSRNTNKDKAHFTTISYSSTMELLNQLIIAKELNYISQKEYENTRMLITKITNMLNALRKYQLNK